MDSFLSKYSNPQHLCVFLCDAIALKNDISVTLGNNLHQKSLCRFRSRSVVTGDCRVQPHKYEN